MQRQRTEQLSNLVFQDLLNTLNVSKRFVEISFADKGTSSFNTAHYYDELTDVDLQYLLKKSSNLSFLNCMDPSTTLVPMGTLTKRVGVAQCIKERNIISFDVDGKDLLKNFKEMSSEEQRNYLKTVSNQVLEKCKNLKLPLWLLVFSGHGFHLHFRTKNLIPFNTALEYKNFYDSIREYLEGLIPSVKFDRACNNIARLMRLPGSTNWKDAQQAIPTEFWFHDSVFSDEFFAKIHIKVKDIKTPQSLGKKELEKSLDFKTILNHFHYAKEFSIEERSDKIICSSPFSADENPSFHYSKEKRQFFDFSTGQGGDLFHLISFFAQLDIKNDFLEVLKIAQNIIGVETNTRPKSQPSSFILRENGLYFLEYHGEDEIEHWISSPFEVLAYSRDYTNRSWGRWISFKDHDQIQKFWSMPMEYLASDGIEIRKNLLNLGLDMSTERRSRGFLLEYIRSQKPSRKVRCVERLGWHGSQYVLPYKVFGEDALEEVVLQGDYQEGFEVKNSLKEWQEYVALPCRNQHMLTMALCIAFAPPLIHLMGEENSGFHFVGPSSIGKTIALKIAASVWGSCGLGGFMHKWRATVNGLEAVAESRNDSLLILDEIGEISPKDAGAAVYMLGNGAGKRRAGKEGSLRASKQWRTIFLSSGEVELSTHLAEDQKTVRGGQEIRCLDLEASHEFGILNEAKNHEEAYQIMENLSQATMKYSGSAIFEFLSCLTNDRNFSKKIREFEKDFLNSLPEIPENSQVRRVLKKFSLVTCAGLLASEYEVLPFSKEEILKSISFVFNSWLNGKNSVFDSETRTIVSQVRMFLQTHGSTHFPLYESLSEKFEGKFYGFRKKNSSGGYDWFVLNEIFRHEVCSGFSIKQVVQILKANNFIKIKNENTSPHRVPHLGIVRLYHLSSEIFN